MRVYLLRVGLGLAVLLGSLSPARAYYDPGVQRWVSRDPLGDAATYQGRIPKTGHNLINELGGVNLYSMVENNPARSIDIDGRAKLNVPPGLRDANWVGNCMLACDNVICKHAAHPTECLKACYSQCQAYEIPSVTDVCKGPKSLKDIIFGYILDWLKGWL